MDSGDDWEQQMGVHKLKMGADQPFYHVLCDDSDRPGDQTTYVAEENLEPFDCYPIQHALIGLFFFEVPELRTYLPKDMLYNMVE